MKIHGHDIVRHRMYPVGLLDEGNNGVPPHSVRFADLHQRRYVEDGECEPKDTVFWTVEIAAGEHQQHSMEIDVLDEASAGNLLYLVARLHEADRLVAHAEDGSAAPSDRGAAADQLVTLASVFGKYGVPVPCTLDVGVVGEAHPPSSPLQQPVINEDCAAVLRQDAADASTAFWTVYEQLPDGTSQARIDILREEDALTVAQLIRRQSELRDFAHLLANGFAGTATSRPLDLADSYLPDVSVLIPAVDGDYGHGFRDGLESMRVALRHAGVPDATIRECLTTTLDAYGNRVDRIAPDATTSVAAEDEGRQPLPALVDPVPLLKALVRHLVDASPDSISESYAEAENTAVADVVEEALRIAGLDECPLMDDRLGDIHDEAADAIEAYIDGPSPG